MCPQNPEFHLKTFGTLLPKLKTEKDKTKNVTNQNLQGTQVNEIAGNYIVKWHLYPESTVTTKSSSNINVNPFMILQAVVMIILS